jgi:hypothetical protein
MSVLLLRLALAGERFERDPGIGIPEELQQEGHLAARMFGALGAATFQVAERLHLAIEQPGQLLYREIESAPQRLELIAGHGTGACVGFHKDTFLEIASFRERRKERLANSQFLIGVRLVVIKPPPLGGGRVTLSPVNTSAFSHIKYTVNVLLESSMLLPYTSPPRSPVRDRLWHAGVPWRVDSTTPMSL